MEYNLSEKVIIVEGIADKRQIQKIIAEDVEIVCTYGTFGVEKFDEMLEEYQLDDKEVYLLVDADEPGEKLRKQFISELPHAVHIYIPEEYQEVELTPEKDRKSTRLNSSHVAISYAVFCLKKKNKH